MAKGSETWEKGARDYSMLLLDNPQEDALPNEANLPLRVLTIGAQTVKARLGTNERSKPLAECEATLELLHTSLRNADGHSLIAQAWRLWTEVLFPDTKIFIHGDYGNAAARGQWLLPALTLSEEELDQASASPHRVITYARHGYLIRQPNILSYEPYNNGYPVDALIDNPPPIDADAERLTLICQLLEAGAVPIVIIDERVQEQVCQNEEKFSADQHTGSQKSVRWLKEMQVYVPEDDEAAGGINLTTDWHLTEKRKQLESWLHETSKTVLERSGFLPLLVIHQGLLDVMAEDGTKEKGAEAREWASGWIKTRKEQGFAEVIVTSGRGEPQDLPANARYLPLSTLIQYAAEQRSKYHLLQALAAARGSDERKEQ